MDISIVIPLFNEEESLPELCSWIEKVMIQNSYSYEVFLIDDGSKDNSWNVIEDISTKNPAIVVDTAAVPPRINISIENTRPRTSSSTHICVRTVDNTQFPPLAA